ncbi:hypothetical protein [Paenirhodobacter sp.]|uniref:hypothetical protein n=1 Tax=Paenirhodobacter sp. TaxID=1965326 RepID=UPI003B3C2654
MRDVITTFLLSVIAILIVYGSFAANIDVIDGFAPGQTLVMILGSIKPGDDDRFTG